MNRMPQRKIFQTKAPPCLQPAFITMFLLSVFLALSIFCPEHPTLYPPQTLFQTHDCLTPNLVQEPEASVPEFPGQRALRGRTPRCPETAPPAHPCHRAAWQESLPPPQGKGRGALLVSHRWHNTGKTEKLCTADVKLRSQT